MRLLAESLQDVFGVVTPPSQIQQYTDAGGTWGINYFLGKLIILIYMTAGVVFVFMIVFGAFQWVISGGEKESVNKARGRIVHAIIGIALLALSGLIITVLGQVLGFRFFGPANGCNGLSLTRCLNQ